MTHTHPHSQDWLGKGYYSSFPVNSSPVDRTLGDRGSKVVAFLCLLGGGLAGSLLASQAAWANPMPEQFLLAQQIVDGLPPPPPLIFGQEAIPNGQSPAQMPQTAPGVPTVAPAAQRYLVVVNGDSPLLLSQVQTIAPGAAVQDYQGQRFIQAGLFNDSSQAQQQVAALAARGIGAQVVTVSSAASAASPAASAPSPQVAATQTVAPPDLLPVSPVPREVEFGQPPPDLNQVDTQPEDTSAPEEAPQANPSNRRSFYVVIPGKSDNLTSISNQVIRLGDGFGIAQLVQENDTPRGSHIQVGPFVDRQAANRWSRYFREFGLDARVYYQR